MAYEIVQGVILVSALLTITAFVYSMLNEDYEITKSRFDKKWPPIDEDEFLRRCPPGTNRDVALRVRVIIAEQLGYPIDQIYPEQNFVDDLGCG